MTRRRKGDPPSAGGDFAKFALCAFGSLICVGAGAGLRPNTELAAILLLVGIAVFSASAAFFLGRLLWFLLARLD